MNDRILKSGLYKLVENSVKNILIGENEEVILLVDFGSLNIKIRLQKNSKLFLFVIINNHGDNNILIEQNEEFSKVNVGALNLSSKNKISLELKNQISGNDCETKINILSLNNDGEININSGIIIEKKSKNSIGELNQENIFLGEKGKIRGIPGLDIRTNRTKANHSLKIEKISREELFYLESRGIDKQNATHIMLISKINNLFSGIPSEYDYFLKEKLDNFLINN